MAGIRRTSDLGTQGIKTILDGSIQTADIANNAITQVKLSTDVPLSGMRNAIINGSFDIWQRGTSFTTNGAYTADRWQMSFTGTGTAQTVSQVGFTPGNQISNQEPITHIRSAVTGGSGNSSLVALTQKIEDVRSCAGQQVAVSFWAKVNSGTANLGLDLYQDFGSGGSTTVGGIGAQKFSLTTSWQRFTAIINVSSISNKTLGANSFLALRFWFSSGSDYNSLNATLGIQSAIFDIWGVQLEKGSQATPFEQRSYAVELQLCQRYYETSNGIVQVVAGATGFGGNTYWSWMPYLVEKRIALAYSTNTSANGLTIKDNSGVANQMTYWKAATQYTATVLSFEAYTTKGHSFVFNGGQMDAGLGRYSWVANAEL